GFCGPVYLDATPARCDLGRSAGGGAGWSAGRLLRAGGPFAAGDTSDLAGAGRVRGGVDAVGAVRGADGRGSGVSGGGASGGGNESGLAADRACIAPERSRRYAH